MSGRILSNGVAMRRGQGMSHKESSYIMQDDMLNPLFTVVEIMTMAASLKLGNALSCKAKSHIVEDILESIGLQGTQHTRCGQLSGGQKKRLSIALELIDNPPVMFLDEPTTGLDSSSTSQLIHLLKGLARGGRNIVCTIHQPSASVLEMFDHIYVIASGRCVYQGASKNIVPFLQSVNLPCPQYHNPADFLLDVVNGDFGQFNDQLQAAAKEICWRSPPPSLQASIKEEENGTNLRVKSQSDKTLVLIKSPSEWVRLWVLLNRCSIQLYRDWTVTHLKIILHFLVGIILGLNFQHMGIDGNRSINNVGYFMCSVVYLGYTSIMPAILKFPAEINIVKKEQFNNWYKLRTYYIAFLLTNIPVQMMFCTVYTSVSYVLSSQIQDWTRFAMFLSMNILNVIISECVGLTMGTTTNLVNGIFTGCVLFCIMFLFAGFLALYNHMPYLMRMATYLSYLRYTMEGMVISMYGYGRPPLECTGENMYCHYRHPAAVIEEIGMTDGNFWTDISVLMCFFVGVAVLAYVSLYRKIKSR